MVIYKYYLYEMQELLNNIENEKFIFVENLKDLENIAGLSKKKLCIAKTDFKDLYLIRRLNKKFPNLEIWLTSSEISRKNILLANASGVKNVISYPVDVKLVQKYFGSHKEQTKILPEVTNYGSLKGLKVMIVDDNQMNVDLLAETLGTLDLDITTFLKPIEASKIVGKEKFDLFLLDIMMPEMSGFELAKIIKHSKLNSDTPIVFISALSDSENKIMGYNIGSSAYIEKPFDVSVVRSQIYNMLKTKRLQDALNDKKETFLAMITHDLKTPIYAEICALELLNKNNEKMDGMQREIITDILSAAKYMKNLVENITQKYKVENESLVLQKVKSSLKNIVIACIEDTKYLFKEKNIKYTLNCNAKEPFAIFDELEIRHLFRYVERGGNLLLALKPGREEYLREVLDYVGIRAVPGVLVADRGEDIAPDVMIGKITDDALPCSYIFDAMRRAWGYMLLSDACGLEFQAGNGFEGVPLIVCDSVWNELQTTDYVNDVVRYDAERGERMGNYAVMSTLQK